MRWFAPIPENAYSESFMGAELVEKCELGVSGISEARGRSRCWNRPASAANVLVEHIHGDQLFEKRRVPPRELEGVWRGGKNIC